CDIESESISASRGRGLCQAVFLTSDTCARRKRESCDHDGNEAFTDFLANCDFAGETVPVEFNLDRVDLRRSRIFLWHNEFEAE
ncbi:MAG: hypothetical protein ACRETL_03625, partial [Gammaproteobacteria bacterium]